MYLLLLQCSHCGLSILYHRAQPTSLRQKGDKESLDEFETLRKKRSSGQNHAGISADPFVWPRVTDHCLSHTFEALVTISNLNLLWIKRSRFKDGGKIKRTARKMFDLGLTAPPAVADLQGKWMVQVSIVGNEDNYVDSETMIGNQCRVRSREETRAADCSEFFKRAYARHAADLLDKHVTPRKSVGGSTHAHGQANGVMNSPNGGRRRSSGKKCPVNKSEENKSEENTSEEKNGENDGTNSHTIISRASSLFNLFSVRKKDNNSNSDSSENEQLSEPMSLGFVDKTKRKVQSTVVGSVLESEYDFPQPRLHATLCSLPYAEKLASSNLDSLRSLGKGFDFDHSQLVRSDSTERMKATSNTFKFRKAVRLRLPKKRSLFEKTKIQIELYFFADSGYNKFCAARTTVDAAEYAGYFMDNEAVFRHSLNMRKPLYGDNGVVATVTLALRHMAPPRRHIVCPVTRGTLIQNTLTLFAEDEQIVATEEVMETSLAVLVPAQFLICQAVHLLQQERTIEEKLPSHLADCVHNFKNDHDGDGDGDSDLIQMLREEFAGPIYEEWTVASTVGSSQHIGNSITTTMSNLVKIWWLIHQHRIHIEQHVDILTGLYLSARRHHSRFRRRGRHLTYGVDEVFINSSKQGIVRDKPFFKSSAQKANPAMSAMPTNLHIQLLCASQKELRATSKKKSHEHAHSSRRTREAFQDLTVGGKSHNEHSWGQELASRTPTQSGVFGLKSSTNNNNRRDSDGFLDLDEDDSVATEQSDNKSSDTANGARGPGLNVEDLENGETEKRRWRNSNLSRRDMELIDRAENVGTRLDKARAKLDERLGKSGDATAVYDTITFGAPAYHAGLFRGGGLFRLRAGVSGLPFDTPANCALSYILRHVKIIDDSHEEGQTNEKGQPHSKRTRSFKEGEPKLRLNKRFSYSGYEESMQRIKRTQSETFSGRKSFQSFVDNDKANIDVSEALQRLVRVQGREDFVMSQLLSAVISSLLFKIDMSVAGRRYRYLELLGKHGFLVQIESLLSTVSKEVAMLQDMYAAYLLLDTVTVKLCRKKDDKETSGISSHRNSMIDSIGSYSPAADGSASVRTSFCEDKDTTKLQVHSILEGDALKKSFFHKEDSSADEASAQQLLKSVEKNISATELYGESSDEENFEFEDEGEISAIPSRHKRRVLRILRSTAKDMFNLRIYRTESEESPLTQNGEKRDSDSSMEGGTPNSFLDRISRPTGGWTVELDLPSSLFDLLPGTLQSKPIELVPLLFTQGINEQQSFANAVSRSGLELQRTINWDSFHTLATFAMEAGPELVGNNMKKLDRDLRALKAQVDEEQRVAGKHPKLLSLAADIVRMLHGGRLTCCKSGKDRTAMGVTYEQARILEHRHGLAQHRVEEVANLMRTEGPRKIVCAKNIGEPLYAFNAFQSALLPPEYRPPAETLSGTSDIAT